MIGKAKADVKKEIMINSLVKDISSINAILDLVDNSIDSAIEKKDLKNTIISIESNDDRIVVRDNCCGISLESLENYVFIFGKESEYDGNEFESIGRFGIGMKRALFKLGYNSEVHTKCDGLEYRVVIDKNEWMKSESWEFDIFDDEPLELDDESYTSIVIKNLYKSIDNKKLLDALEKTYSRFIQNGITIKLNDVELNSKTTKLISCEDISPFKKSFYVDKVKATVICGIEKYSPKETGWNIYCNNRMILENDKTEDTGWSVSYHADYAAFRGYVFLESKDNLKLPITSTKVGADFDHENYPDIKSVMQEGFESVKTHLQRIGNLRKDTKQEIRAKWDKMNKINVYDLISITDTNFVLEEYTDIPKTTKTISFEADLDDFERVSKNLCIDSAKDVGKRLFENYLKSLNK